MACVSLKRDKKTVPETSTRYCQNIRSTPPVPGGTVADIHVYVYVYDKSTSQKKRLDHSLRPGYKGQKMPETARSEQNRQEEARRSKKD